MLTPVREYLRQTPNDYYHMETANIIGERNLPTVSPLAANLHTHTHAHAHAHTHAPTHAHTHARTHEHTHTLISIKYRGIRQMLSPPWRTPTWEQRRDSSAIVSQLSAVGLFIIHDYDCHKNNMKDLLRSHHPAFWQSSVYSEIPSG